MLRDMPRYFDQQMVNMRAGLKRGFTPSQIMLKGRDIGVAEVVEAKSPEESPFYAPFREWPASISPELRAALRSEEHTSELQSLMSITYAVFFLTIKKTTS